MRQSAAFGMPGFDIPLHIIAETPLMKWAEQLRLLLSPTHLAMLATMYVLQVG